jgi:hypothetical protein
MVGRSGILARPDGISIDFLKHAWIGGSAMGLWTAVSDDLGGNNPPQVVEGECWRDRIFALFPSGNFS